jgi:uncharacterized membrane protein
MSSSTAPAEVRSGTRARRHLPQLALAIAATLLVQFLVHRAVLAGTPTPIAALVPLLLPGALAIWGGHRRGRGAGLLAVVVVTGIAAIGLAWPAAARILPLACQLAVCLALAWLFARTLLPGREPLVTRLARAVHGELPPPIEAYTRNVTVAWSAFLFVLAGSSVLLYALAPLPAWSLFANLLFVPLIAAMFLAEYAWRTLRYPWYAHATLAQSVSAFHRLREGAARRDRLP